MRERQILYSFTYMWYLKARQNKQMNTAKTDSYKDQRDGCQGVEGASEGGKGKYIGQYCDGFPW